MWLTPPVMNSEITVLARGLKCGLRGAADEFCGPDTQAWSATVGAARRPSVPSRFASARPLIPPPAWNNMLRREMVLNCDMRASLIDVQKLVQVDDDVAEIRQRIQSGGVSCLTV